MEEYIWEHCYFRSGLQISDSQQELVKLKLMIIFAEYNIIGEL